VAAIPTREAASTKKTGAERVPRPPRKTFSRVLAAATRTTARTADRKERVAGATTTLAVTDTAAELERNETTTRGCRKTSTETATGTGRQTTEGTQALKTFSLQIKNLLVGCRFHQGGPSGSGGFGGGGGGGNNSGNHFGAGFNNSNNMYSGSNEQPPNFGGQRDRFMGPSSSNYPDWRSSGGGNRREFDNRRPQN